MSGTACSRRSGSTARRSSGNRARWTPGGAAIVTGTPTLPRGPKPTGSVRGRCEWVARLRREHPNLRAALEFSVADPKEAAAAMRIASSLEHHWVARGTLSEGRHWLDRALAHPTAAPVERARALRLDAWLAVLQSDTNEAARMLDEARPLADAAGDDVARAYVLQSSGMLAMFQGDLSSAVDLLDQAVAMFRSAGHIMGQVQTAFLLGMNLGLAGAGERAIEAHRECLALTEPLGELWFRSYSLWALGLDAWRTGDQQRATALEKDSLRMKRDLDDHLSIALCLEALAWLATTEHDPERSPTLLGAADAIWRVIGMSLTEIPFFASYRAEGEAAARRRLPERAFEAAFRRGAQLTLADAIALALEEEVPARTETGRVEGVDGPHPPGAGDRGAGRPGHVQQGDRRPAGDLDAHGRGPCRAHPDQAGVHLPVPDRRVDGGTHGRTPGGAAPAAVTVG